MSFLSHFLGEITMANSAGEGPSECADAWQVGADESFIEFPNRTIDLYYKWIIYIIIYICMIIFLFYDCNQL